MGGPQDPSLSGVVGAVGADGAKALGNVAGLHSGLMQGIKDSANADPNAGGFWNDLTHFGKGVWDGSLGIAKGLINTANRTVMTAAELGTGGLVGTQGIGNFSGNLNDATQTFKNLGKEAWNMANLTTFKHIGAYYESMLHRYGWSYVLGNLTPNVVSALLGGEVLTGAGMASDAVDAATIAKLASKVEEGIATPDELARLAAARSRQMGRADARNAFEEAKARGEDNLTQVLNKTNLSYRKGVQALKDNAVFRWGPGAAIKGAGNVIKATNGLKAQLFYQLTGMGANTKPELQHLWEQTRDGHPIDAYGRKMGTMGQDIADILGLAHSSWERSLLSGGIDATTMFMGDPFATYGHLRQGMNSAEGFGGVLGKWWTGIGFETGADVQRVWDKTRESRGAVKYMATHSADEIGRAFNGMFPANVLTRLGDAKSNQEVVDILAGLADAHALALNVMPTLGITRRAFAALKNFFYRDVAFTQGGEELGKAFEEAFDKVGLKSRPRSLMESQSVDWNNRASVIASRETAKQFDQAPWFIEEASKLGELPRVENRSFLVGDKNAIPAIISWYRATGLWNRYEIDDLAKVLRAADTPEDAYRALVNLSGHMMVAAMLRRSGGKMSLEWVNDEFRKAASEEVMKMLDMGIGGKGDYVNGESGGALSVLHNPEDYNQTGHFGIGTTHVGRAMFLDPRQLVGLAEVMSKALASAQTGIENSVAELRKLQEAELENAARIKGATLRGVGKKLRTAIDELNGKFGLERGSTFKPNEPSHNFYKFQDANQEQVIHSGWSYGNTYRHVLEGTGDIFRELSVREDFAAGSYIQEKINRLERHFKMEEEIAAGTRAEDDSFKFALEKNPEKFNQMIKMWEEQPYNTIEQKLAIDLNLNLLKGNFDEAKQILEELKNLQRSDSFWAHTPIVDKTINTSAQYLKAGAEDAFRKVRQLIINSNGDRFANVALQVSKETQRLENLLKDTEALKQDLLEKKRDAYLKALYAGDTQAMRAANAMPSPNDEYVSTLRGQLAGLRMAERQLFSQLSNPEMTLRDFRETVWRKQADTAEAKAIEKDVRNKAAHAFEEYRAKNGSYLNWTGLMADGANKALSQWFLPQMLSTGGYVIRIGTSELLPSLARIGPRNYVTSMLGNSIRKHLLNAPPISKEEQKLLEREVQSAADNLLASSTDKSVRQFLVGALTGAEIAILKGMSPERGARMLDDFVGAMLNTGGHTPDISHNTSSLMTPENVSANTQQETHGYDEKTGERVRSRMYRTGTYTKVSGEHIGNGLQENLMRINHDSILKLPVIELDRIAKTTGYTAFGSKDAHDALWSRLEDFVYRELLQMPNEELAILRRSKWELSNDLTTGDPLRDWAKALSYNAMHVMGGYDKAGQYVLHPELIRQALTGDILPAHELAAWATKTPAHPKNLIAAEFTKYPWRSSGSSNLNNAINHLLSFPNRINAQTVDRFFGKFIGWVSREPLFLWEYHMAMESLRPKIVAGIITQDAAELFALNSGFRRMVSFVHNPADRVLLEKNTRWLAPFWFAKNQAYRRAFRFMEDNPGAFVYYLRAAFAITNGLHHYEKSGTTIEIPHSSFLTNFMGWAGKGMIGGGAQWEDYGLNLALNPSSLKTISPLGDQFGVRMALPDFGSYVSIPVHIAQHWWGDKDWYKSLSDTLLGPVGSKTGLLNDFIPAPVIRGGGTVGADIASQIMGWNLQGPADGLLATVHQEAYVAILDRQWNTFIQDYYKQNPDLATDAKHNGAVAYADYQMQLLYHDKAKWQELMHRAQHAADGIYLTKVLVGFAAPAAVSLKANFSAYKEFNAISKRKNPDGSPYSFQQSMYEFSIEHPEKVLDLISKSYTPRGAVAETSDFMKFYDTSPKLFQNDGMPEFMSYLVPYGGAYSSPARQAQIALGLRSRANNDQFFNNLMTTLGNDYYYRSLEPVFYREYGAYFGDNDPRNVIMSYGRQQMLAAAQKWGLTVNPIWHEQGSPFGDKSKSRQAIAIEQAGKFANDRSLYEPFIKNGMLTDYEIKAIRDGVAFRKEYDGYLAQMTSTSDQWMIKDFIKIHFEGLAADPQNARLSQFFLNVLAKEQY